ncbi:MAG: hypothetical protein ACO1SV_18595 [Fimbriimonas sp.]
MVQNAEFGELCAEAWEVRHRFGEYSLGPPGTTPPLEELALRRPGYSETDYEAALRAAESVDRVVRGLLSRDERRIYAEARESDGTHRFGRLWHPNLQPLIDELNERFPWFPTDKCGRALGHAWYYWHLR